MSKNVACFRDMLQKGKKSLEESENIIKGLKSEMELVTKTASQFAAELNKWNKLNANLRTKLEFISQSTITEDNNGKSK